MKTLRFKRGSTFAADCTISQTASIENLNDVTITSSIEDSEGKLHSAIVTIINSNDRTFKVYISNTTRFSLGSAMWDIKLSRSGVVFYSETVEIIIVKQITP